jgi:hypothetical protein
LVSVAIGLNFWLGGSKEEERHDRANDLSSWVMRQMHEYEKKQPSCHTLS